MVLPPVPPPSPEERRAYIVTSQIAWAITGLLLLFVVVAAASTRLEFRASHLPLNAVVLPVFGLVAIVYTYLRFDIRLAGAADAIALLAGFTWIAAVYTYVMTSLGADLPPWDARFAAADGLFGLDWKAHLAWLDQRPGLGGALRQAYLSVIEQVACLIVLLSVWGQQRRLQVFILAGQLCLIFCGACAFLTPAAGVYDFLNISAIVDHPNLALTKTVEQPTETILALRGATPIAELGEMQGVIVFPSFHMALAVMFAWGFWGIPVVRWIAIAVNAAMAAATPVIGGHYFVDLVAGALLAVIALAAASALRAAAERLAATGSRATAPAAPALAGSGKPG
jgi:PAP2 superfamily